MAQAILIKQWCDICLGGGVEVEGQTYRIDVRIQDEPDSPRPFVVELCGEHGAELANAVLALVSLGRPPEKTAPAVKARAKADDGTPEIVACPTCGDTYGAVSTLRAHVRREHGTSLAGVGFYPANFTCPTCGDGFPNRQGMAVHVRSAHPARGKKTA